MNDKIMIHSATAGKAIYIYFSKGAYGMTNATAIEIAPEYSDGKYTGFIWEPFANDSYGITIREAGRNTKTMREQLYNKVCDKLRADGKLTGHHPIPFMP